MIPDPRRDRRSPASRFVRWRVTPWLGWLFLAGAPLALLWGK